MPARGLRTVSPFLAALFVFVGCLPARARPVPTGPPPPGWEDPRRHQSSIFGIEYVFPHDHNQPLETADRYRGLGARWIKFSRVQWAAIEPDPPKEGRHRYDWNLLDVYVATWQRAGYNIQFQISATSDWALGEMGGKGTDRLGMQIFAFFRKMSRGVKPEHLADYAAFLTALVERYDGDGQDDMPGLLVPILHHEIETEAQNIGFWAGSVEDYRTLLKTAYPAVKRACPRAQVILTGIQLADVVQDVPSDDLLDARFRSILTRLPPGARELGERVRDFVPAFFTMHDSFDLVEFHSLEDYTAIPGTYAWIKGQMRKHGYDKPVWVGDASSAIEVGSTGGITPERGLTDRQRREVRHALSGSWNPKDKQVVAWYRAEQAKLAVKKIVVAAGCGAERILVAALEDWPPNTPWPFHGLVEKDGTPRPVYHAYKLLAGKIEGFRSVEKIEAGRGVWAYRFDTASGPVLVAWYDDGRVRQPGDSDSLAQATIPFPAASARVTMFPTAGTSATGPKTEARASGGRLGLPLSQTPVLIEPMYH